MELDVLRAATLTEVGNIVLNGVLGSVTNIFGESVTYEVPSYVEATIEDLLKSMPGLHAGLVLAHTRFVTGPDASVSREGDVEGKIHVLFSTESMESLTEKIATVAEPRST